MKLTEIFDKTIDYRVIVNRGDRFKADFTAGERSIVFNAFKLARADRVDAVFDWDLEFREEDKHGNESYSITNSGNEFAVMSTIKKIIYDFINARNPPTFAFSADNRAQSRVTLYDRMARKFLSTEYTLEKTVMKRETLFVFTKK